MNKVLAFQPETNWREGLIRDSRGIPVGNLRNALHTLRHAPDWQGVLRYDEFASQVLTLKPPPWEGAAAEEVWGDEHDCRACEWIQEQEIPVSVGVVGRAIQTIAREMRFHPLRDYLNGLRWDGTARIDTWLIDYFGVKDIPYVRAVGPRFLISAVARVFEPGCQVDHVPIFEGPQGILKSSALRDLVTPWFTDRISKLGGKDSAMEVAGVWLIELSELDALIRAPNSTIKSFITSRWDRFRPPYGKHVVDRPRQCVFVGTINPSGGYLKDPTGARRFWPVVCGVIDLARLVSDRHQLWAEAALRLPGRCSVVVGSSDPQAVSFVSQALKRDKQNGIESCWLQTSMQHCVGHIGRCVDSDQ